MDAPLPKLSANDVARRIVRHFQSEGFNGISEALILRVTLRHDDRRRIEAAFEDAAEHHTMPPVHECFELRCIGHHADTRSLAEARAALQSDFSHALRIELPHLFFNPAPVLIDDALASGTRYDAMIKLQDNRDGAAYAILLNDPDAAFLEYLGAHAGGDWERVMGDFALTAVALGAEITLD